MSPSPWNQECLLLPSVKQTFTSFVSKASHASHMKHQPHDMDELMEWVFGEQVATEHEEEDTEK